MPSPPKPWEAGGAQAANSSALATSTMTSTSAAPAIPARTTTTGLAGNTTGNPRSYIWLCMWFFKYLTLMCPQAIALTEEDTIVWED